MSHGKMAPQAYTKQILQEAFEWWSEQPESFRSQIQDSDDLVGYYLRVHRGEAVTQAVDDSGNGFTKSSQESFSSELKGLAQDLSSFEGYSESKKAQRPHFLSKDHSATSHRANKHNQSGAQGGSGAFSQKKPQQPQQIQMPQPQPQQLQQQQQLSLPTMSNQLLVPQAQSDKPVQNMNGQFFKLDGRSLQMVKEARELLNLSSDEEALRALISFGAQKFKNLLKS